MKMIDSVLGNVADPAWKARIAGASVDILSLDQWQAQKNRFRRNTVGGADLAISLERQVHLHDGDILSWDEATHEAVVTRIQLQEVMVIRLDGLLAESPEILARTCLEIGHALGNQHWPAVVKGTTVYVPLTVSRQVMNSVMKTHAFPGITYDFAPGQTVIAYLYPHESRRLFGGADSVPHTHVHVQEHPEGPAGSHGNGHDHQH